MRVVIDQVSQRQQDILALARLHGRVSVEDLAARFEVTPQTIRKDLNELCDSRLLSRIHGGAVVASGVENVSYEARRLVAHGEKRAIGGAAARLIPNSASLFINIGTTTEEVARALGDHEDLLVITNNLNVATLLYRHPKMSLIVAGGPVRRGDGAVIGSAAGDFINQFKVDYASDQAILPIPQDRWFVVAAIAAAFVVPPLVASEYWLQAILIPFLMLTPGAADNLAGTDSLEMCATSPLADTIASNPSMYYLNVHSFPNFNPGAIRAQLSD